MSKTYGVEDFAKAAGVKPATARGIFRKMEVSTGEGGAYSFSKEELQKLVSKHKEGAVSRKEPKKSAEKGLKKPAEKKSKKTEAKKAKAKKVVKPTSKRDNNSGVEQTAH